MSKIVKVSHHGNFEKTKNLLRNIKLRKLFERLDRYGEEGVMLLQAATPKRTGRTADSWYYKVVKSDSMVTLEFHNDSMGSDGKTPIAILIQMGHGTRGGGYVAPIDYINPAIDPLFEKMKADIVERVKDL